MSVSARDPARGPTPLERPARRASASERLVASSAEADVAQHLLAQAKAAYERGPTPESRKRLLRAAADALERETGFDELWDEVSRDWLRRAR